MATTIESLRKLGLKVNGTEPTNNNIGNVINEIADDYAGGSGGATYTAGSGIVIDDDLSTGDKVIMIDQEDIPYKTDFKTINNESILGTGNITISGGGTQLYQHNVVVAAGEDTATIRIISLTSAAYTSASAVGRDFKKIKIINSFDDESQFATYGVVDDVVDYSNQLYFVGYYINDVSDTGNYTMTPLDIGAAFDFVSDTVTAL